MSFTVDTEPNLTEPLTVQQTADITKVQTTHTTVKGKQVERNVTGNKTMREEFKIQKSYKALLLSSFKIIQFIFSIHIHTIVILLNIIFIK